MSRHQWYPTGEVLTGTGIAGPSWIIKCSRCKKTARIEVWSGEGDIEFNSRGLQVPCEPDPPAPPPKPPKYETTPSGLIIKHED